MRRPTLLFGPLFAVLLLTGTALGATAPHEMVTATTSSPTGAAHLATDAVPLPADVPVHPLPAATPLSVSFTLTNPHASEIRTFLQQAEDPTSPAFDHFVTFPQYLERFAPPVADVQGVEAALSAAGAWHITPTADRSSVNAEFTAGSLEQFLGVSLVSYGSMTGVPLYTAVGSVSLPASLSGLVDGVGGLSDVSTARFVASGLASTLEAPAVPSRLAEFAHDNVSGEDWFVGSDYAQLYGATQLFPGTGSVPNATYPESVAIATLLVSGYNDTLNENLPPWDPAVVQAYFNGTLGPGWPFSSLTGVPIPVAAVLPPLPGPYGNVNDSSGYETENSLDLEMAGSLAPGASLYNFYFAASLLTGSVTDGNVADYFATALAAAVAYPYGPQHLAAVSCSFGLPDLEDAAWDAALTTAALNGVTVVSASGDQGNAPDSLTGRTDGPWPVWPASDAMDTLGALSVGGVSLSVTGNASMYFNGTSLNLSYDPEVGALSGVSAWYDTTDVSGQVAGTEGGVSTVYPEPPWQFRSAAEWPIVNATLEQKGSTLGRSGPDVAMPGNVTIATVAADLSGNIYFDVLEGTSIAAPVLAGVLADVIAVENNGSSGGWTSLGFLDPLIYQFGSYFVTHPGATGDPFYDVTAGENYVFSAGTGWDATTGWGMVEAPWFLSALHNETLLSYVYSGPTPVLPIVPSGPTGNIPWPVIFAIFAVGIVVAIVLVAVAARPSRAQSKPPVVPWGAQGGGSPPNGVPGYPGTHPGATFLCPYCGAIRPAEPVRCPQCGAL